MKTLRKTYIKPRSTAYDIPTEEELLAGSPGIKATPAGYVLLDETDAKEETEPTTPSPTPKKWVTFD